MGRIHLWDQSRPLSSRSLMYPNYWIVWTRLLLSLGSHFHPFSVSEEYKFSERCQSLLWEFRSHFTRLRSNPIDLSSMQDWQQQQERPQTGSSERIVMNPDCGVLARRISWMRSIKVPMSIFTSAKSPAARSGLNALGFSSPATSTTILQYKPQAIGMDWARI